MSEKSVVAGIISINVFCLLLLANTLSISFYESQIFFEQRGLLHYFINFSTNIFGQNDLALRLPVIIIHSANTLLMYLVSFKYLHKRNDRIWSLSLFVLLPGVISAALVVNNAVLVIFFLLLFIYLYEKDHVYAQLVLPIALFIDNAFAILYLALFFYNIKKRDNFLIIYSLVLFAISMYMFGFEVGGRPRGYFVDALGVYSAIFSPVIFFYFFYTMYRVFIKEEKDILWYISFTALSFSLILSFRQRIALEDFAPFLVIALPIMSKTFLHSYRIRLSMFRKNYKVLLTLAMSLLAINLIMIVNNKSLYHLLEKPHKHFNYKNHVAKELASTLKEKGIVEVDVLDDYKLQERLKFYGIKMSDKTLMTSYEFLDYTDTIEIKYYGKLVDTFYIKR